MSYPGRALKLGEPKGEVMSRVRSQLRSLQYDLAAHGPFDDVVLRNVRLFQTRNVDEFGRNLAADGVIGMLTWNALFALKAVVVSQPANRLAGAAIGEARTQLGVRENPRNSNRGEAVEKYLGSVGLKGGYAWCAAFVYWAFQSAATSLGAQNDCIRSAGVLAQWQKSGEKKLRRLQARDAKNDPTLILPGMVFVIDWGGGLGHMGFVTAVRGAVFDTIEGNTDASRSREGGGVYGHYRKVAEINKGFILYGEGT